MSATLKKLAPKHIEAMHRLLEHGGDPKSVGIVAHELGMRAQTLAWWRMSPVWRARFEQERDEWEANLRDVPISSRRYRLQRRQRELDRLEEVRYTANSLGEVAIAARATDAVLSSAERETAMLDRAGDPIDPSRCEARAVEGSWSVATVVPQAARVAFGRYLLALARMEHCLDVPVTELVQRLGVPLELPAAPLDESEPVSEGAGAD